MLVKDIDKPDRECRNFEQDLLDKLPPLSADLKKEVLDSVGEAVVASNLSWEEENPCPNCGSEDLTHVCANTEIIKSGGGTVSIDGSIPFDEILACWCTNCETVLRAHPGLNLSDIPRDNGGALLPRSFGEYPKAPSDELIELLNEQTQADAAWTVGTPCSNCGSHSLVKTSIEIEHTNSYELAPPTLNERIAVLRYHCNDCQTILDRNLIDPLIPEVRP